MAVIAKTYGAKQANLNGVEITDSASYIAANGCVYPQPQGIATDQKRGYNVDWDVYFDDHGGTSFFRSASINLNNGAVRSTQQLLSDSAYSGWTGPGALDQKNNGSTSMSVPTNKQYEFYTWSGNASAYYTGVPVSTPGTIPPRVMALRVADSPDTTLSGDIESTGKHDTTPRPNAWTPFDSNESCSAFVCRKIAAENTNALNINSQRSQTLPVFGYWITAPE